MRKRNVRLLLLLVTALSMIGENYAVAQVPSFGIDDFRAPSDPRWRAITSRDVDAAYRLLLENHPGAVPELHDLAFQRRLKDAHVRALQRASVVNTYEGYLFALAGFATDMGDKHIWSRPTFIVNLPRWAGIIISKRGEAWMVTDTDGDRSSLLGASLISCDGEDAQEVARKNIGGFRAVWHIGAQQIQYAPWLLVDEGNPFIARPKSCVFELNAKRQTVALEWTRIKRDNLLPRLKKAVGAGAAGFGIRRVGEGYWIALQDLMSDDARAVVKAVEDQKTALRQVPYVVLDLRGNGGGSSLMGRQIAASLMGSAAVDARLGPASDNCGGPDGAWRASEDNIKHLEYLKTTPLVVRGGPEIQEMVEDILKKARAARSQGREFSGPIICPEEPSNVSAAALPPSLMKGEVILLTDNLCFSSCLSVTDDFRNLGALHVGQTTDAATHFVDVREQYMPSGYSIFSTLMSVDGGSPVDNGPFEPALTFNGDISDTPALEDWVKGTAVHFERKSLR
jgi:hypothetical protein